LANFNSQIKLGLPEERMYLDLQVLLILQIESSLNIMLYSEITMINKTFLLDMNQKKGAKGITPGTLYLEYVNRFRKS